MITAKAKYSYGIGAFGKDLAYAVVALYSMYFFTEVAGVNPAFVGTLFFVARIWDALNDPIMGFFVDNTRGRWGKFRPWILIGTLMSAVTTVLVFWIPEQVPTTAYVAVMYVLWTMAYTVMDIPFWSMIPALSRTKEEREKVAVVPRVFASFAWLILGVAGLPIIAALGDGDKAQGYFRLAAIIAVIFVIAEIICVVNVKEIYPSDPDAEKVTVGGAFKLIGQNDQLRWLALILIAFNLVMQLASSSALYYFKYVVGNEGMFSIYSAGSGLAQLGALALLPKITSSIGREKTFGLATLLPIIGSIAMLVVGMTTSGQGAVSSALTLISAAISNVGIGLFLGLSTVMMADVVDYGEFKFSSRNESIYFSVQPLTVKFAIAIASLVVGTSLGIIGYKAGAAEQSDTTITGLRVLMILLPSILSAVTYVIYKKFYKINGTFHDEILNTLAGSAKADGAA